MRPIIGFAGAGLLFWSLLCLGLWAIVALGGDLLHWIVTSLLGAARDGVAVGILRFVEAFGTVVVAWVWLAGAALIAFLGWLARSATRDSATIRVATFRTGDWEMREMKDVTPPRDPDHDVPRLPGR